MNKSNLFILGIVILAIAGIVVFTSQSQEKENDTSSSKQDLVQSEIADPKTITPSDHILGDPNATVVLIEYSDLECSYCKTFHSTLHQAVNQYPGKVKWVFRHSKLVFC